MYTDDNFYNGKAYRYIYLRYVIRIIINIPKAQQNL